MGLNVNYSLLIEGNNSTSSIPKYTRYYTPGFFLESEFEACISEFNQEIRESRRFLTSLCEVEYVNEASAVDFVNGVRYVTDKVKTAVIKVMTLIIDAIKKAIESIEKFASAAWNKIDTKLRPNEKLNILRKILAEADEPITVDIASIEPTRDLLDKSFPDTSIIGSDLVKMATDTMTDYCANIMIKDKLKADAITLGPDADAAESFVNFIESEKNKMLSKIFGRYSYDETAITKSAHEVADKAFGVSTKETVKITDSLYLAACDNLAKNSLNGIVRDMKATMDQIQKNYKAISFEMDSITNTVKRFDKLASNDYSVDMKERYHKATKLITDRVNRALNVIQQVVSANFTLVNRKAARTYEIYGFAGDSARVKNKCDVLIIKEIGARSGYNLNPKVAGMSESVDEKYREYYERINEAAATRAEVIDIVNQALEAEGLKTHISKNGEWGCDNWTSGKSKTLCLGGFGKENWDKAFKIIKECLPDGYSANQDNYFTIFINATEEPVKESIGDVFNGREEVDEFFQIQENFNMATVLAEEAFLEESFTGAIMTAILEAEVDQGNTSGSDSKPQATETTTQSTTIATKAGSTVMEFVQKIIGSFGQAMQRFKNRIDELIIKNPLNQKYWQDNKEKIRNLALTDTKVNEWYDYKIDSFATSTFIKFDQNSADLKDDESFQNAIIKKIAGGNPPKFDEKDTFSQKINKIYQGEFTKDENGDGKTLQEVGYNHQKAYSMVDEIMTRGFGGEILGKVSDDYKNIDADYKKVKQNYDSIATQMKTSTTVEQKANETETKKPEPQNAAAMVEDDFRFNLAEHFGLVHHEASFSVGQADAQVANTNGAGGSKSETNKELDAMIKRCFQYNTVAVTAKMTAALGAYKQYMGLFKAVYKPAKEDKKQNDQQQKQEEKTEEDK